VVTGGVVTGGLGGGMVTGGGVHRRRGHRNNRVALTAEEFALSPTALKAEAT